MARRSDHRRRGCGKMGNAQRFPRERSSRLFHNLLHVRILLVSDNSSCCAAFLRCTLFATLRSSAVLRTDLRTSSRVSTHHATCRESFPPARSAWAAPAECGPTHNKDAKCPAVSFLRTRLAQRVGVRTGLTLGISSFRLRRFIRSLSRLLQNFA